MKILVTGATGQLGYDVCRLLDARGVEYKGVSSTNFNITDKDQTIKYLTAYVPDAVIHCASYNQVDAAEDNTEICMAVNVTGAENIANACRQCGASMLLLSSDYVFDGTKCSPYETDDEVNPLSVYGRSKAESEKKVCEILEHYYVVRISWLFGRHGNNFVKTICNLAKMSSNINVVNDQIGSPTFTEDLVPLLLSIIKSGEYGTYHATNEGFCSWADFARAIVERSGSDCQIKDISSLEYASRVIRPHNSRLSKAKLSKYGFQRLPDWQDALDRFFYQYI